MDDNFPVDPAWERSRYDASAGAPSNLNLTQSSFVQTCRRISTALSRSDSSNGSNCMEVIGVVLQAGQIFSPGATGHFLPCFKASSDRITFTGTQRYDSFNKTELDNIFTSKTRAHDYCKSDGYSNATPASSATKELTACALHEQETKQTSTPGDSQMLQWSVCIDFACNVELVVVSFRFRNCGSFEHMEGLSFVSPSGRFVGTLREAFLTSMALCAKQHARDQRRQM